MARILPLAVLFSNLLLLANAKKNCPAGYFKNSDNTCEECPLGTFQVQKNVCTPCPVGTYGLAPGRTSNIVCISCAPGTFNPIEGATSSTACKPCPPGMDSKGSFSGCIKCGAGKKVRRKVSITDTVETCEACEANSFSDQSSSRDCEACPPGTESEKGADKCRPCREGTFRNVSGKCRECAQGTFTGEKGSSSCNLCPPGTFSSRGATSCTPCAAGMFQIEVAASRCKQCPSGTSSLGTNPAGCKDPLRGCPFGTFENNDGECEACLPGQKFDALSNKCVSCAVDEVSNGGVTRQCTKCPLDREPSRGFGNLDGMVCSCRAGSANPGSLPNIPCASCPPGQIGTPPDDSARTGAVNVDRDFDRTCYSCPSGNFVKGERSCYQCPSGSVLDYEREICAKCPAGTVVGMMGRRPGPALGCVSVETGCPLGTVARGGKCLNGACPPGSFPSRRKVCIQCAPGFLRGSRRSCVQCRGRARSAGGVVERCSPCPKGQRGVGNECVCDAGLTLVDGECVKCPRGTVSVANSTCVLCPHGTISSGVARRECESCSKDRIAKGTGAVRKCVKCPPGSSLHRKSNVISCMPLDPYSKDTTFLELLREVNPA